MSTNTINPLRFDNKKTQNIRVTLDGTVARRINNNFFTRGLVYGTRPIKHNEKIRFQLLENGSNLGGFIYIGLSINSRNFKQDWSRFFPKDLCQQRRNLFFFLSPDGYVHYGIENQELGVFEGQVKSQQALWPIFSIYGNSCGIVLIGNNSDDLGSCGTDKKRVPFLLHKNHSKGLMVSRNWFQKLDKGYHQGLVFSQDPLKVSETIIMIIAPNGTGPFTGFLSIGVTSFNPSEVPIDNVNQMVDRPESWIPICDFSKLESRDQIHLTLSSMGQISFNLNMGKFNGIVHVEAALKLYLFVSVCGSRQDVHLFSGSESVLKVEDCVVCYENAIETALYRCGHCCMCFGCAVEQWRGKGDGHCPLCRAVIRDVVRIRREL